MFKGIIIISMGAYINDIYKKRFVLFLLFSLFGLLGKTFGFEAAPKYSPIHIKTQEINLSGKVVDAEGVPLPGVNIMVKETNNGTMTDFDGNYILENVSVDALLEFSYIGFTSQTIAVEGKSTINVTMQPDVQQLDDVVVIGYGTTKNGDVAGAIAHGGINKMNNRMAHFVKHISPGFGCW